MEKTHFVKDSTELRKLIAENPELPIVVMVGREAACDDFGFTLCTSVNCGISEVLDCDVPWSSDVYTDRDEFEESLSNYLCDKEEYLKLWEDEFNEVLRFHKEKFEPYWRKAIVIYADN